MAFGSLLQRLLRINAASPYSWTLPAADAQGVLVSDGAGTVSLTRAPSLTTPSMTVPVVSSSINLTGGQIQFPATQVPSSDPNNLDDYEEGTWTPVLGGSGGQSGQSYSSQIGTYVKKGQDVSVQCLVNLSTKGTITSQVQISGLPFAAGAQYATAAIMFSTMNTNWIYLVGRLDSGGSIVTVFGIAAAGVSMSTLATGDIANTTLMAFAMSYRASA